jgi:hypothetical protein
MVDLAEFDPISEEKSNSDRLLSAPQVKSSGKDKASLEASEGRRASGLEIHR